MPDPKKQEQEYIRLYMYTCAEALDDIIYKQRLRASCPWKTNDLTECVAKGEVEQSTTIHQYGYFCFSEVYNSAAMWGLYADRGKGACLLFSFPIIRDSDNVLSIKGTKYLIRKIIYTDEKVDSDDIYALLTSKSSAWSNEKEYRIIEKLCKMSAEKNEKHNLWNFYDQNLIPYLRCIVLGPKCNLYEQELKQDIIKSIENRQIRKGNHILCNANFISNNIKIIRAKLSPNEFEYNVNTSDIPDITPQNNTYPSKIYVHPQKTVPHIY